MHGGVFRRYEGCDGGPAGVAGQECCAVGWVGRPEDLGVDGADADQGMVECIADIVEILDLQMAAQYWTAERRPVIRDCLWPPSSPGMNCARVVP